MTLLDYQDISVTDKKIMKSKIKVLIRICYILPKLMEHQLLIK